MSKFKCRRLESISAPISNLSISGNNGWLWAAGCEPDGLRGRRKGGETLAMLEPDWPIRSECSAAQGGLAQFLEEQSKDLAADWGVSVGVLQFKKPPLTMVLGSRGKWGAVNLKTMGGVMNTLEVPVYRASAGLDRVTGSGKPRYTPCSRAVGGHSAW